MRFLQVDVFADRPFTGNPLAVFPDAGALTAAQMQAIASEMNLSETTFVTRSVADSYDVRIFTPRTEFGFAGHPTLGTAWSLRHLGVLKGERIVQRSASADTEVSFDRDRVWMERSGTVHADLESRDGDANQRVATLLGLEAAAVGLEARELGRSGRLRPALADAGLPQLLVPVRDLSSLARCSPPPDLTRYGADGVYCFTAVKAGGIRARGLFPPRTGATEDPATGSAAAALGVYLVDRVGDIDFEIVQGVEIDRPSRLYVKGRAGSVRVGGRCELALEGELTTLPKSR